MSNAPLRVATVMERLNAPEVGLREVGTATDLDEAVNAKPRALPAAYVLTEESADPPGGSATGLHKQWVTAVLKVVLFAASSRANDGGIHQRAVLDTLIEKVRDRLIGWIPRDGMTPVALIASRDERAKGSQLCCQLLFFTRYRIGVTSS